MDDIREPANRPAGPAVTTIDKGTDLDRLVDLEDEAAERPGNPGECAPERDERGRI